MSVVEIKNISKKYYIKQNNDKYQTLRDNIVIWFKDIFKKKVDLEEFWALDGINFNIEKGEVIGIIGANGAGKSTLLKILSKITPPTNGKIKIKGKLSSLLEVGTGFHPELTGRENIYLNGSILGMNKKNIDKRFNEIVDFSGVKKFLETPVKRYSSGMYVRLAFSVAAHMDADILLIDEVLSIGDFEFQKKCLGKMDQMAKTKNKTIIFVSHDMDAIQNLCTKCILLENGKIKSFGGPIKIVKEYLQNKKDNSKIDLRLDQKHKNDPDYELLSLVLENSINDKFSVYWDETIDLKLKIKSKKDINDLSFGIGCTTLNNIPLFTVRDSDYINDNFKFEKDSIHEINIKIEHNLSPGFYNLILGISKGGVSDYYNPQIALLEILGHGGKKQYPYKNNGLIHCFSRWTN